ncbi:hypothetical protein J4760_10155 [Salinicoccus sp. ID82-1]|uniref:hypothetical protein n=1 Tax=Salinicoccus sp. ID82-1 TaxID=2820269 RepID=UPI001F4394A3|nr:hypothetical protein [Salinicoccus sp. ID82-1]MCG1010380.1 hypothetical protein [Salinicoccus sp. ID82-1]
MIVKGYYSSSKNWSFPEVVIDYFLEDIEDELTLSNVQSNIAILENYRKSSNEDAIDIVLGNYTLDVQGSDEACATIRGLEYVEHILKGTNAEK